MLNVSPFTGEILWRVRHQANLPAVGMILHARFDHLQESFPYKKFSSKGFALLWRKPVALLLKTCNPVVYTWVSCESFDCKESFLLSLFCRGDLFYRGGCREEPLYQLDRVITIQYQIPAEQLTLEEDAMLSSLEEGALSKCSQAEHMISCKAYDCLKYIVRDVCSTKAIIEVNFIPTCSWLTKWAAFLNLSSFTGI